ncbi:MAG: metallophosphoesterase family protein [Chloroflexi bacterium]|nr:metallophosphoesterase family protein [Chloroflexota bacterium]
MRIGLLTDTHLPNMIRDLDELGPEPTEFFSSVDLILHGGDLIYTRVLDWCEQFAPVLCATGNNDPYEDHRSKEVQTLEVEGWRIGMVHELGEHRPMEKVRAKFPTPMDIMIGGHTHQETLYEREGVVIMNTGSLTFPRHKELRLGGVGLLELTPGSLRAEVMPLGETTGRPNPCEALSLNITREG